MTTIKVTCSVCKGDCFIENEAGTAGLPCYKCGATGEEDIECPTCGGEGRLETLVGLTYEGVDTWRVEPCPTCNADELLNFRYNRAILRLGGA
jgi:hypothetical protein